jgi:hypothetical protein
LCGFTAQARDRAVSVEDVRHCLLAGTVSRSGPGQHTLRLFDAKGNQVRVFRFEENTGVTLQGLSKGVYAYRLENGTEMRFGKLVVGE